MKILLMVLGCTWCVHAMDYDAVNSPQPPSSNGGTPRSSDFVSENTTPRRWWPGKGDEIKLYQPTDFPDEIPVAENLPFHYVKELTGKISVEDDCGDGSAKLTVNFTALTTRRYGTRTRWVTTNDGARQVQEKIPDKVFTEAEMGSWCVGIGDFVNFKVKKSKPGVWKCVSEGYLSAIMDCQNHTRGLLGGAGFGGSFNAAKHIAVGSLVSVEGIACDDYPVYASNESHLVNVIFNGAQMASLRARKLGNMKHLISEMEKKHKKETQMNQDLSWMLRPRRLIVKHNKGFGREQNRKENALAQLMARTFPNLLESWKGFAGSDFPGRR